MLKIEPVQSVTMHTVVTGQAPPRPDVAFEGPMLLEPVKEVPTLTASIQESIPQELPKTASLIPVFGLAGFLSLALYGGLRVVRR